MSTPSLHWLSASGEEQIYPITTPETLIGRKSDADIVFSNQHISRHHARIIRTNDDFVLTDLGSTHGTFVNGKRIERHVLDEADEIQLGRDRVTLHFFLGDGSIKARRDPRLDSSEIFQQSLTNLGRLLPSNLSDLEKISFVLDFQYQWEQAYTQDAAFVHILESAVKISGAERAFVLLRQGDSFNYAAGIDGQGHALPETEFQTSRGVVNDVATTGEPVFMVEGLKGKFVTQASIVAMNVRALACLPLKGVRTQSGSSEIMGIIYLDSRKPMHSLSGLDQRILSKLAVEAGNVLERLELIKGIEQRKRLEQELALAEETQRSLLPQSLPNIPGFRIRAFSKPTRYVGGDFYDFIATNPSSFTGVLADVSGKGIAASLLSSMTLGCLEMQLRSGLTPAQALSRVNKFLCERSSTSRFVTMFAFTLDHDGKGTFVNAGHNPVYLLRAATGEIEELHSNSIVVGAFVFATYESSPLRLENGDLLLVYSDGLTEAENPEGEMLGGEEVKAIMKAQAGLGAQGVEEALLDKIHTFTQGRSQTDDITLVIVEKI